MSEVGDYQFSAGVESVFVNDLSFLTQNRLQIMVNNGLIGIALVVLTLFLSKPSSRNLGLHRCPGGHRRYSGAASFGLTVNMITMAGFVVVPVCLVDDAVVVAERIIFRKDQGMKGIEAAREGTPMLFAP